MTMSKKPGPKYLFGPYFLEPAEARLMRQDQEIMLSPTLLRLLTELVKNSPHICRYDDLLAAVWPNVKVELSNITVGVVTLRRIIPRNYIQTIPGHGYRFVEKVTVLTATALQHSDTATSDSAPIAPPVGALPLNSPFYIERLIDAEFHAAITRGDSFALVKGARQVGKTSLLARGLESARRSGARVVLTDFQKLTEDACSSLKKFLRALAESIADSLELDSPGTWNDRVSTTTNLERYLRHDVLERVEGRLIWGLDETDRVFGYAYRNDVFGLFRSWHNARALDPDGPWSRLTLALAYATEAHLFLTNLNQSPFNVGTRLVLEDFALQQVMELNRRYGSLLNEAEAAEYFGLLGGHPYLAHYGLYFMKTHNLGWPGFNALADSENGPFGDHLRHILQLLRTDPDLNESAQKMLKGGVGLGMAEFHRLRSAGILTGNLPRDAHFRCKLYENYMKRQDELK